MKKPKKFIKKPKEVEKKEFPRIYRIITEFGKIRLGWPSRRFISYCFSVLFLLGIIIAAHSLYTTYLEKQKVDAKRAQLVKEIEYWKSVAEKHENYRDAYLHLATLSYRIGEIGKARYFAEKSFELDPNSKDVESVLKLVK